MGVVIKKITPAPSSVGCWSEPTAAIDLQMPVGQGAELDAYVDGVLLPALAAEGTVGLHFGKRVPAQSAVLRAALETYGRCGVQLSLSPPVCYHPLCSRTEHPSAFEYPQPYFA